MANIDPQLLDDAVSLLAQYRDLERNVELIRREIGEGVEHPANLERVADKADNAAHAATRLARDAALVADRHGRLDPNVIHTAWSRV